MAKKQHLIYETSQVKALAVGRWPALLGLSAEILDRSQEHPCPKCGGTTRFRAFPDFDKTGAVFCNQCFNSRNGDGIAAYMWLNGCDFPTAVNALGDAIGAPKIAPKSRSKAKAKSAAGEDSDQEKGKEKFVWKPWNAGLANIYCARKRGIKPEALTRLKARLAMHINVCVLALPITNGAGSLIGHVATSVTAGQLLTRKKELTTWKIVFDPNVEKQKGIVATPNLLNAEARQSLTRIYKVEGVSDLLAIVPLLQPDEAAFCNPAGAGENPANFPWLLEWITGKEYVVIHDRDKAGVKGSLGTVTKGVAKPGWATWAIDKASEVRNVELPFPLVDSKGKDFRQWVIDGHAGQPDALPNLVEASPIITERITQQVIEDGSDPHYLARVNLENYQGTHGRRLVFWKNEWYRWKAGCYIKIEGSELRSKVTAAIRAEFENQWREEFATYQEFRKDAKYDPDKDKGPPKVAKVTPHLVGAVIAAMASIVQLPGTVPMPCWLADRSKRRYVSMQNGILDLDNLFAGSELSEFLLPHSSDWFSPFQLGYKFDFAPQCPIWLEYLNYSMEGDQERIDLLQEWAGYLLTTTNYLQKFLVLEGLGGNGKTVYFAAMRAMLGRANVSSVALENFAGRFDLFSTLGKAVNVCGDVGEVDAVAEGALKQFTGGDSMTFDRKGMDPLEQIPTAKLMMAWNLRPRFKDRSSGVWRRMMIVPFEREVEESRRITGMDSDDYWLSSGEVPAILRWAIEGLDRLQTMGRFTRPAVSEAAAREYRQESNPASDFLSECVIESPEGRIACQRLYEFYVSWCRQAGHNYPLSRSHFGKEVRKAFPSVDRRLQRTNHTDATTEDRDRVWYYIGIDFSVDYIAGNAIYDIPD